MKREPESGGSGAKMWERGRERRGYRFSNITLLTLDGRRIGALERSAKAAVRARALLLDSTKGGLFEIETRHIT